MHPNTGCELEDHSWWAFWGGTPWQINNDAFSFDYPFPWTKEMDNIADPPIIPNTESSLLTRSFMQENHDH